MKLFGSKLTEISEKVFDIVTVVGDLCVMFCVMFSSEWGPKELEPKYRLKGLKWAFTENHDFYLSI